MKYEIHYSIGEYDDYIVIEGETIEDVKSAADREMSARGLTEEKNHLWSREITD